MKNTVLLAAGFALLGLAVPAAAETQDSMVHQCLDLTADQEASDLCQAMRVEYLAKIDACMTAAQVLAAATATPGKSVNSHGFRARYQNCTVEARSSLDPVAQ